MNPHQITANAESPETNRIVSLRIDGHATVGAASVTPIVVWKRLGHGVEMNNHLLWRNTAALRKGRTASLAIALLTGVLIVSAASTASAASIIAGGLDGGTTCQLRSTGNVYCWGRNDHGQLGNGTRKGSTVPVLVDGISNVQSIFGDGEENCAILADRSTACWGISIPFKGDGLRPSLVDGMTDAITGSVTSGQICVIRTDHSVWCIGDPINGYYYNGPAQLTAVDQVTAVASTNQNVCWIEVVGTVKCGTAAVAGIQNATAITATNDNACAVVSDGGVLCWTHTIDVAASSPVAVAGVSNAVTIASHDGERYAGDQRATGSEFFCAALRDGGVKCWGTNPHATLGDGSTLTSDTPVAIPGLSNVVDVAVGRGYACAALANDQAACWGVNRDGQLGDGTKNDRFRPLATSPSKLRIKQTSPRVKVRKVPARIGRGWYVRQKIRLSLTFNATTNTDAAHRCPAKTYVGLDDGEVPPWGEGKQGSKHMGYNGGFWRQDGRIARVKRIGLTCRAQFSMNYGSPISSRLNAVGKVRNNRKPKFRHSMTFDVGFPRGGTFSETMVRTPVTIR